jgi:branched-chain amino acid aminotransferase
MITGKILGNTYVRNSKAAEVSGYVPDMSADIFYEVLRLTDGQVLFLHDHLLRLQASISGSGIAYPGDSMIIENLALLVRENPFQNGNIRISLQGSGRKETDLHCYFVPYIYPDPQMYREGVSLHIYPHVRPNPGIKKWDDQFRKAVSAYLLTHEVYEVVLKNPQNQITEGSRSNIFFIDTRDYLITPPSRDVLRGITRKYVLEIASLEGLQILEKRMDLEALDNMDAVFISGTSPKVLPVKQIDEHSYGVDHPVLRMLMEKFEILVRQNLTRL